MSRSVEKTCSAVAGESYCSMTDFKALDQNVHVSLHLRNFRYTSSAFDMCLGSPECITYALYVVHSEVFVSSFIVIVAHCTDST